MITEKDVKENIAECVDCIKDDIESGEYADEDAVWEGIYEVTDLVWDQLNCSIGRFDQVSADDVPWLPAVQNAVTVLAYCVNNGTQADDSGMWEGYVNPFAQIGAMAYCSLENTIREEVYNSGILDTFDEEDENENEE